MDKDIELLRELKGQLVDKMVIESRRTSMNTNEIIKCGVYIGALSNAIKIMEKLVCLCLYVFIPVIPLR